MIDRAEAVGRVVMFAVEKASRLAVWLRPTRHSRVSRTFSLLFWRAIRMHGVSTGTDALRVLRTVIYRLSCGMMHVYLGRVSRDSGISSDVGPCGYQTAEAPPRRFHIQGSSRQQRNTRPLSLTAPIHASSCPLQPHITHHCHHDELRALSAPPAVHVHARRGSSHYGAVSQALASWHRWRYHWIHRPRPRHYRVE